jgi:simple sugar transport system permease protein
VSRLFRSNEVLVAATIVLLSLVIGLNNPTFFSVGNLFDLLRSSVVMGIFAMGVLIVIVSGGIDVSFTAIAVFALYLHHPHSQTKSARRVDWGTGLRLRRIGLGWG